jgi:hypothetical protein
MTNAWRGRILQTIWVILEDGFVIFLNIIQDRELKDSLRITQCNSKWQLVPFYKTGAIYFTISNNNVMSF